MPRRLQEAGHRGSEADAAHGVRMCGRARSVLSSWEDMTVVVCLQAAPGHGRRTGFREAAVGLAHGVGHLRSPQGAAHTLQFRWPKTCTNGDGRQPPHVADAVIKAGDGPWRPCPWPAVMADPDGDWLCEEHLDKLWTCPDCGGFPCVPKSPH